MVVVPVGGNEQKISAIGLYVASFPGLHRSYRRLNINFMKTEGPQQVGMRMCVGTQCSASVLPLILPTHLLFDLQGGS